MRRHRSHSGLSSFQDDQEPGPSRDYPRSTLGGTQPSGVSPRNWRSSVNRQTSNMQNNAQYRQRLTMGAAPTHRSQVNRQNSHNAVNRDGVRNLNQRQETNFHGNNRSRYPNNHFNRNHSNHSSRVQSREDTNVNDHNQDNTRHQAGQPYKTRNRLLGFRALEDLANADVSDILTKIYDQKDSFINLINSSIEKKDLFVLILQVLGKVCFSTFEQIKTNIMLELCNSNFIRNFRNYLMDLPYEQRKATNHMYWDHQTGFWSDFVLFSECIINIAPSVAFEKCNSLIDATSKICLEGLRERHSFTLPEELDTKLKQLRERLVIVEKEDKKLPKYKTMNTSQFSAPPDNFRELSVVPNKEDLFKSQPFLRPNIVNGAYADIEHYLDVQFRLLREDCFGPLREGINQYAEEPNRKKFDHIRVFKDVKFIAPYVSSNKFGCIVQMDDKTVKRFGKQNWAHSKRFIFGSLLIFTKDNCRSFLVATIMEREVKLLQQGKIPISVLNSEAANIMYNDDAYVMFESEVYFEPYFHILKALQDPMFPQHLAMSEYIVHVQPQPKHPSYLSENTIYKMELHNFEQFKCRALVDITWPTASELGFNDSQYEAYQLALTREFAVIQGPPGTGKTFLGIKVAKTLLNNLDGSAGCIMFIVCFTNHALDQFLEAMLKVTNSIVRVGGQSRNQAMEQINLTHLRRQNKSSRYRMFNEFRHTLKISVLSVKNLYEKIESINNGVLNYYSLRGYVDEIQLIYDFYKTRKRAYDDPLKAWLFEGMKMINIEEIVNDEIVEEYETLNDIDDDIFAREEVNLDNLEAEDDDINVDEQDVKTSFVLNEAETDLARKIAYYGKCNILKEKEELRHEIRNLKSCIDYFKEMSVYQRRPSRIGPNQLYLYNPSTIPHIERWCLYFQWANIVINDIKNKMKPHQDSLEEANTAYEEARMSVDLEILKKVKIVGMTTSGAARLQKLIRALAPPIVIVEEAAEVLEAHIVTSLTRNCEHLILIGDHQQLRPSAAHMRLARHFDIEISLFERMIMNNVHSRRLGVQHRMRPEIATLITPHIYKDLENHHSVHRFPDVRGITKNLFFLTHDYKEEDVEDSSSKSNRLEGDLTLRLANYIMQQGYEPEDVTILAAYSGQMFYMRKQRNSYAHLSKVKITVVDNYQGEESKIILLSLVRNNSANKIGFLGIENRVCVAISRAREGFYILGNIETLTSNSDLWKKIANSLEENGSLGTALKLKCESHPDQITLISSPKDFKKVPEGGCFLKCSYSLPCGHPCPLVCHGYDRGHSTTRCPMKCERIICDLQHVCPLPCSVKCQPCKVMLLKTLPCRHTLQLPCFRDPSDPAIKCNVILDVVMPHCGHEVKKPCHVDIKSMSCPVRCVNRVEKCGHECQRTCHVNDDPEHEKYNCQKPCAKAKKGCTANLLGDRGEHQCLKKCYEPCNDCEVVVLKKRTTCKHPERVQCNKNPDEIICRKNCARMLPCNHHCKKKCYEKCGDCKEQVKKMIPYCKHEIVTDCCTAPTRDMCKQKCNRLFPCGHPCKGYCKDECNPNTCNELIQRKFDSPCGHEAFLPCHAFNLMFQDKLTSSMRNQLLLENCRQPCMQTLECGHECSGTCSGCRQGRIHIPCTKTCHQTLICGHECEEPCNQLCPPCKKPCGVKCAHSNCSLSCGAPCVSCQEKCNRRCEHGSCTRRCGEPCSRAACDEPCPRRLRCKHPCRGLCGEPCPEICNICDPENFPKDFLGDDFEDTDKFIKLQDCPHVMEVENMDNLMTGDTETVQIRKCPMCRQPIVNTYRYKDIVNEMFRNDINPIKEKVYGTPQQIKAKQIEINDMVSRIAVVHPLINRDNKTWCEAFKKIILTLKAKKKISLINLEMYHVGLNILDILGNCYKKYTDAKLTELNDFLEIQINIICTIINNNTHKISQQQQKDINNEIIRIDYVIQLSKILSHTAYKTTKNNPVVMNATKAAENTVMSVFQFNEDNSLEALNELQRSVKVSGIVTKQERDLIVKAIGLKAGHWFKCPNGHYYCIGECGGAMQESKCPECGARIGGSSHRLRGDNRHAPEMDGSPYAAWSEAYNNMGNFQF